MKVPLFLAFVLLLSPNLNAQNNAPRIFLRGEIVRDGGPLPNYLTLELRSLNDMRPSDRVVVMEDGRFEFPNIPIGDYEARITNIQGDVIQEDLVRVREMGAGLMIRIREPRKETFSGPAVVSVQRLLHPIPSKASQEFVRSTETGDLNKAVEHLEKALRIFPDYMEAHNNLGVAYINLNQFDRAADELRKAIALDPKAEKSQLNLGLALTALGRYAEAESPIRKALELAPGLVDVHYALGQALYQQRKDTPEAIDSLHKAATRFPMARVFLAQVFVDHGAIPDAIAELQRYLETGRQQKRTEVQRWLAQLKESPQP